ncbi:hypothetical protein P872_01240 [Rhodonellum psychrophilum GCM71 = DSM 17998]|uniref:Uncharacterized protein n=2 Tax=Rhodonellum TaxID=336827 RepID=U5C6V3_9BACT|nr:hypothetical protein P872_01240 [Rhodonellum psychrophilum GCM71 = DSM 17998]SDZ04859.1 hypothetical protein SAMN05444412_10534 [Rhodonellum ikkaensis]
MNWKLASFIQATEQRWGAKNQRVGCFSLIVVYKRLKWIGCVLGDNIGTQDLTCNVICIWFKRS